MKHLSLSFLAGLLMVSSAFAPATDLIYPELAQTFKSLKKGIAITDTRKDDLDGIQQLSIVSRSKKQSVIIEFLGSDGFSAPIAKAALKAVLASYGITNVKIFAVDSAISIKVAPALAKLGFKVSGNEAKYSDQGSVTLDTLPSNPQAIHVLIQEGASSLLAGPDRFTVKLKYAPIAAGATDEQCETQAKLVTAEMLYAAGKFKENW